MSEDERRREWVLPLALTIFVVVWTALTTAGVMTLGSDLPFDQRALSFAKAHGTIRDLEVVTEDDGESSYDVTVYSIDYEIDGVRRSRRFRSNEGAWFEPSMEVRLGEPRVGDAIDVFYDPRNPRIATLERDRLGAHLAGMVVLVPFVTAAIGGWVLVAWLLYHRGRPPESVDPIERIGDRTWFRLDHGQFPVVVVASSLVALFVTLPCSCCAAPIAGEGMPLALTVWSIYLGAALLFLVSARHSKRVGKYDLAVDHAHKTLLLPGKTLSSAREELPIATIAGIEIASWSDDRTERALLWIHRVDGTRIERRLNQLPPAAERIAERLRQALAEAGTDAS